MMRQDRFTEQAQEVLQVSQELVREQRHAQWDVEHVFFALVQRKDGLAREVLNKILAERTGQPLEKIQRDTERDYSLSADEAKDYGLVDQVIAKRP